MCQMTKLAVFEHASTDNYTTWSLMLNWLIIRLQARAAVLFVQNTLMEIFALPHTHTHTLWL